MSERCPSCGEEYANHLGLIGTCYRLQEAIGVVGELETKINRLTAELATERKSNEKTYDHNNRLINEVDRLTAEVESWKARYNLADRAYKRLKEAEPGTLMDMITDLQSRLSRYEAGVRVEGMVHEWNCAKSPYIKTSGHMEMPRKFIGQRVTVLVMKKEDGDE